MRTVYADAGYWIALLNADDDGHGRAVAESEQLGSAKIITSEIVIIEVFNFFAGRGEQYRDAVMGWMLDIYSNREVSVYPLTKDLLGDGVVLYANRRDKQWGLTDCISFEIMRRFDMQEALAFDKHFSQAGFIALLR